MATSSFFLLKPEGHRQRPSVYERCAFLLLCDNERVRVASCVASRPPRTVVRWLVMATKAVQVPDSVCGHNKSLFMSQTEQLTSPDCVFSVPGWCLQRWRLTNVGLTFLQLSGNHQCFRKRSIGFTDTFHEANLWKGGTAFIFNVEKTSQTYLWKPGKEGRTRSKWSASNLQWKGSTGYIVPPRVAAHVKQKLMVRFSPKMRKLREPPLFESSWAARLNMLPAAAWTTETKEVGLR